MGIDINLLRTDKGGNPELIRKSEKLRYRNEEGMQNVEEVIRLDEQWRKSGLTSEVPAGPALQGLQRAQQGHRQPQEEQGERRRGDQEDRPDQEGPAGRGGA